MYELYSEFQRLENQEIFEKQYISSITTDEELNAIVKGDSCVYVPRICRELLFFIDLHDSKLYQEITVRPWQVETNADVTDKLAKKRAVEAFRDFKRILEKKIPDVVCIVDSDYEFLLLCSDDYVFARCVDGEGHQGIGVFKYEDNSEGNETYYKMMKESLYDRT